MDKFLGVLDAFRCYFDSDIEIFLRNKAIEFIERDWCAVYLILDRSSFEEGIVKIEAYFTLSHKAIISDNLSKSKVKDVSGFKNVDSMHFVLIGQLGKYIEKFSNVLKKSNISGNEILNFAFEVIKGASKLIPCRSVLVECNDNIKLHKFYKNYGFIFLQNDGKHCQFYRHSN